MDILVLFILIAIGFFVLKKPITVFFLSFFDTEELTATKEKADIYKNIKL